MGLIKSVSGIRGIVRAEDPRGITMTPEVARRMGRAFVSHLWRRGDGGRGLRLIGARDGRRGGEALLQAFGEGAAESGANLHPLGIVTTPGTAMAIRALGADGGVVITASHNPGEWNGIKLMTVEGQAPSASEAEAVFRVFDSGEFAEVSRGGQSGRASEGQSARSASCPSSVPLPYGRGSDQSGRGSDQSGRGSDQTGRPSHGHAESMMGFDPHEHHVRAVMAVVDAERIRRRAFSVALDSINGAGAVAGRMLLERLGCRVTPLNATPGVEFAHVPEPIEANLRELCAQVRRVSADVGFAQDPDADRLAIVDETGRFIGEEYTLALCAQRVLQTRSGPVAANLSTSRMIDDIASRLTPASPVHRSAVGEANVVEMMRRHHCIAGGEGNGGFIDPRVVYVRDSLVSMALVLDLLAAEGECVSRAVARFPAYAIVKDKITCDAAAIRSALAAVRHGFRDGQLNDLDGVRIDWPELKQWLHVRGSNTEPILRLIAEAPTAEAARGLIEQARGLIRE